jgi:hypothetical protein
MNSFDHKEVVPPVKTNFCVSLEKLYSGTTKKIHVFCSLVFSFFLSLFADSHVADHKARHPSEWQANDGVEGIRDSRAAGLESRH